MTSSSPMVSENMEIIIYREIYMLVLDSYRPHKSSDTAQKA